MPYKDQDKNREACARAVAKRANSLRAERSGLSKDALYDIAREIHGRTKYCPSCGEHVLIGAAGWYAQPQRVDGVTGHCRPCFLERKRLGQS